MTIKYLDSKRIVLDSTPTFSADYTSGSSWTQVGTHITITGGYAFNDDGGSAHDDYVHTPIGSTLSDDKWVSEFEYYNFGSGAINLYPFCLTAGTSTVGTSNQDGVFMVESNPNMLQIRYKDGSNTMTGDNVNSSSMSSNTQYYCRVTRDGQVLTLKIYTNPARTSQHGSTLTTTIPSGTTVSGLTTLHHSMRSTEGGGTSGYDYKIRDVKVWNGVTEVPAKPTNVPDNSILVEKDNAKRFWFDAVLAPTMSNDVYESTSGWTNTTGGDMAIDTTNKGVTYTDVNVGDTGIGRAIGTTLSNSKWLVQFTFEVADWNTNDTGLVSLTDDHTQGFKVSGLNTVTFMPQGASYWRFVLLSGQTNSYAENPSPNSKFAVNTQYWVDMYRDGTIVKCKVWTNSGRTGTPHWTSNDLTVGSNADDLTGIQHWNETTADIDIGTCWIREVKVYDGVTSVTPATWTMQPTFRDDFSSNSGWVYTGTVSYNASGYQNLNFARNGSNNGCYHDLTTVSDSAWVLRAKLHLTTKSTSSQNSFIGLTNTTSGSNSSQDAIGMFFIAVSNTISAVDCDGQAISAGGNGDVSFTTTNGNDYWVQITRLTPTTMRVEIFDNANYTGTASITINSTIPSGITGLRYIKIENREELSNNSTSDVWTGDDVKFYNGVTSIN